MSFKPSWLFYQYIASLSDVKRAVCLSERDLAMLNSFTHTLGWHTRWVESFSDYSPIYDATKQQNIREWAKQLSYSLDTNIGNECGGGSSDCERCVTYDFSDQSIEELVTFYPISPFSGAWFPEWPYIANPWNIAQVPEAGGIEPDDLTISSTAFFISTLNPWTFVDHFPAIAFNVTAAEHVKLTLLERPQGGFGLLSVDGTIQEFIDLQSFQFGEIEAYIDVIEDYWGALTGDELLGEVFSVDIKMPDLGTHRIALTFCPRILIGIPPIGIGGGIRSIEVCGENAELSIIPEFRIVDCNLEVRRAPNLSWESLGNVCGEDGEDGEDGEQGEQGEQGIPGEDGEDGICPDCDVPEVGGEPPDRDGGEFTADRACGGARDIVVGMITGLYAVSGYYDTEPTPTATGARDAYLNAAVVLYDLNANKYKDSGLSAAFDAFQAFYEADTVGAPDDILASTVVLDNNKVDIIQDLYCEVVLNEGLSSTILYAWLDGIVSEYDPFDFSFNMRYLMSMALASDIYSDGALRRPASCPSCDPDPTPDGATWGHSWDLTSAQADIVVNTGIQQATGVLADNGVVRLNISADSVTTHELTHVWIHLTEVRDPADAGSTPDSSDRVRAFIGGTEMLEELFPDILDPLYSLDPPTGLASNYMQVETRYQYFGSPSEDYEHTEIQIYGTGTKPDFIDGTNIVIE